MSENIGSKENGNIFATINAVQGFNPYEYATVYPPKEGEPPSYYLDVKYRVAWFRLVHPKGKIVKEIKLSDEKMAIVECRVYADVSDAPEAFISNGFAQRFYDATSPYGQRFLEIAETVAVGRALSNAGFNILSKEDGDDEAGQADAPIKDRKQSPAPTQSPQNQSAEQQQLPPQQSPPQQTPPPNQGETGELSVEEIMRTMTPEEAMAVIVPFNGKNKGKSLAQVAKEDVRNLEWIANEYAGPNNRLRAAALILIKAGQKLAG